MRKKYSFKNDYSEGAHAKILQRLVETNLEQQTGYGEDDFCTEAKRRISDVMQSSTSDIHFISGGTQANLIFISSVLRPYEAAIAATSGHIAVHETGAIEATGHKVIVVETKDGKLTCQHVESVLKTHPDEHMVKPKLVYISNTTEVGTVYTKEELVCLYHFCKEKDLYLYLDGARLAMALTSDKSDLMLSDYAQYTDAFYIGGTKNGALIGEALVLNNPLFIDSFRYNIKQKGGLLAKGRVLGIQFMELFNNDLYFELGHHANAMAFKLADEFKKMNFQFYTEPQSNQIFPIFPNKLIEQLLTKYEFYVWDAVDENQSAVRLVCSWATSQKVVDEFIADVRSFIC